MIVLGFILVLTLKPITGQEHRMIAVENWTTCEEFLNNTEFDYHKVVDVDWKIFYFWNYETESSYHIKFNLAEEILVDRFRVELEKVDPSINWTRAVLFMESSIDISALYIQTDTPGLFRLIPSIAVQAGNVPPNLLFGLKLVEPGYLGIMNCVYRLCYALASVDQLPDDDKLEVEAKKLNFYGHQNRSYLSQQDIRPPLSPYLEDDSDDDEQVEVDNDHMLPNDL